MGRRRKKKYGKIKSTKAKEENERLAREVKGADGVKGENKMHEGENKM